MLVLLMLGLLGRLVEESAAGGSSSLSRDLDAASRKATDPWSVERSRSHMDESPEIFLRRSAGGNVSGWLRNKIPDLTIACREHKTDIYIDVGMPANPELGEYNRYTVRVRVDRGPAATEHWSESTDHSALFAPQPIALARRLAKAKTLRFEFTPFNASPALAEFDLTGLDRHLPELASACGW